GEVAHFAGNDGKAAALFTRTCRLYRCVEGEDVGLEGDAVNDADDVFDLFGAVVDGAHGANDLLYNFAAFDGDTGGGHGQLVGLLGVLGVLFDGGGEFFHAGGSLLQTGGLFFRALR